MPSSINCLVFFICLLTTALKCGAARPNKLINLFGNRGNRGPQDSRDQISQRIWVHAYKSARNYDRISYGDGPQKILSLPQYDATKNTTLFYFPGWTENPKDKDSINYVTDALLMRDDINVFVWDYSQNVQGNDNIQYLRSYINASTVGYLVGKWLQDLSLQMDDPDTKIRLVGHSMGSHIMSFATNVYGKGKLRITALDPAYPLYIGPFAHLTLVDGSFVDIIHTDSARYGHPESLGHADFFPNNGIRDQPYCLTTGHNETGDFCSHHMSYRYWAESAKPGNERIFMAQRCDRRSPCSMFTALSSCTCAEYGPGQVVMGFAADPSLSGNFYLDTSEQPPFGKS